MQLPPAAPMALWPSLLAVQTRGDSSEGHEHHALHLVIAREGTLRARVGDEAHATISAGVLTAPDVPRAIDALDRDVILLFIEPESDPGTRVAMSAPARRISDAERDALLADLARSPGTQDLAEWMPRAIDRLAGDRAPERRLHPRVRRLLRILRDRPLDADTSLEALAAEVELSPSRLMHVFTESIGIPLRRYLLWLKVQRAAVAIVNGSTLSAAATEAGFADAAHMSRTFRGMFGLPPSALQRRSQAARASG